MENIVRKGEIACNKQFLHFAQCFLPYMALFFLFQMYFKMLSAICFYLHQSKILSSGNGLKRRNHDLDVQSLSLMESTGVFQGSGLGQDTSEPQPRTGEAMESHE